MRVGVGCVTPPPNISTFGPDGYYKVGPMKPNSEPVLCVVQRAGWEAMVISPVCMEHYGNYSSTKHLKITFTIF